MEGEERERGSVVEDTVTPAEEEEVVADSVAVGKRGSERKVREREKETRATQLEPQEWKIRVEERVSN